MAPAMEVRLSLLLLVSVTTASCLQQFMYKYEKPQFSKSLSAEETGSLDEIKADVSDMEEDNITILIEEVDEGDNALESREESLESRDDDRWSLLDEEMTKEKEESHFDDDISDFNENLYSGIIDMELNEENIDDSTDYKTWSPLNDESIAGSEQKSDEEDVNGNKFISDSMENYFEFESPLINMENNHDTQREASIEDDRMKVIDGSSFERDINKYKDASSENDWRFINSDENLTELINKNVSFGKVEDDENLVELIDETDSFRKEKDEKVNLEMSEYSPSYMDDLDKSLESSGADTEGKYYEIYSLEKPTSSSYEIRNPSGETNEKDDGKCPKVLEPLVKKLEDMTQGNYVSHIKEKTFEKSGEVIGSSEEFEEVNFDNEYYDDLDYDRSTSQHKKHKRHILLDDLKFQNQYNLLPEILKILYRKQEPISKVPKEYEKFDRMKNIEDNKLLNRDPLMQLIKQIIKSNSIKKQLSPINQLEKNYGEKELKQIMVANYTPLTDNFQDEEIEEILNQLLLNIETENSQNQEFNKMITSLDPPKVDEINPLLQLNDQVSQIFHTNKDVSEEKNIIHNTYTKIKHLINQAQNIYEKRKHGSLENKEMLERKELNKDRENQLKFILNYLKKDIDQEKTKLDSDYAIYDEATDYSSLGYSGEISTSLLNKKNEEKLKLGRKGRQLNMNIPIRNRIKQNKNINSDTHLNTFKEIDMSLEDQPSSALLENENSRIYENTRIDEKSPKVSKEIPSDYKSFAKILNNIIMDDEFVDKYRTLKNPVTSTSTNDIFKEIETPVTSTYTKDIFKENETNSKKKRQGKSLQYSSKTNNANNDNQIFSSQNTQTFHGRPQNINMQYENNAYMDKSHNQFVDSELFPPIIFYDPIISQNDKNANGGSITGENCGHISLLDDTLPNEGTQNIDNVYMDEDYDLGNGNIIGNVYTYHEQAQDNNRLSNLKYNYNTKIKHEYQYNPANNYQIIDRNKVRYNMFNGNNNNPGVIYHKPIDRNRVRYYGHNWDNTDADLTPNGNYHNPVNDYEQQNFHFRPVKDPVRRPCRRGKRSLGNSALDCSYQYRNRKYLTNIDTGENQFQKNNNMKDHNLMWRGKSGRSLNWANVENIESFNGNIDHFMKTKDTQYDDQIEPNNNQAKLKYENLEGVNDSLEKANTKNRLKTYEPSLPNTNDEAIDEKRDVYDYEKSINSKSTILQGNENDKAPAYALNKSDNEIDDNENFSDVIDDRRGRMIGHNLISNVKSNLTDDSIGRTSSKVGLQNQRYMLKTSINTNTTYTITDGDLSTSNTTTIIRNKTEVIDPLLENKTQISILDKQITNDDSSNKAKLTPSNPSNCDYSEYGSRHSMNLKQPEDCHIVRSDSIGEADKSLILKEHNDIRAKLAGGAEERGKSGPQPSGSNIRELRWNDDLAKVAQAWSKQCIQEHDCNGCRKICSRKYAVGQNIFIKKQHNPEYDWSEVIKSFYDEVDYLPRDIIASFSSAKNPKEIYGHYTQVVWAETYEIGCAVSTSQEEDGVLVHLYVCNYGPAANIAGWPVYLEGAPASGCSDGVSESYPDLCS